MNQIKIILSLLLIVVFNSCISDRLPPEPVEIERPSFSSFEKIGGTSLNVPLDSQIKMYFNEPMDLNSFQNNFIVKSESGEIKGTFSYGENDTIVVFTPNSNYNPAEFYEAILLGNVRDIHGNSMISPAEDDEPQSTWFFTSGEYSKDGFPYIFIRDKSNKNMLYRIHNLNNYKDSLLLPGEVDYQTSAIEVEANSDKLFVVNLRQTDGQVTIIDPNDFSIIGKAQVGLGPTNISFSSDKAFVPSPSSKSFSIINLNTLSTDQIYEFADGFRPKDVVFSNLTNNLYLYHNTTSEIKVVNSNNFDDSHIISSGLSARLLDIEITKDGKFLYLLETNSRRLAIINVENETSEVIDIGFEYLTDITMGNQFYYLTYYKGTGGSDIAGILKLDISTNSIVEQLEWEYQVDQMQLTAAEELLYAVTPVDSTVQIIETKTMKNIASTKVNGSLKFIAVTNQNY